MAGRPPRSDEQASFDKRMGERLRHFRESLGDDWGQERMAAELDVSTAQYQKWEQRGPIPPFYIARICLRFSFKPWHLLTGQPSFTESIRAYRGAPVEIMSAAKSKVTKPNPKDTIRHGRKSARGGGK